MPTKTFNQSIAEKPSLGDIFEAMLVRQRRQAERKTPAMPTVMNVFGFRFFFYSLEGAEPPHIHVEREQCTAKFWLDPVQLAGSRGFRSHELNRIRALVIEHCVAFKEAWHGHFGTEA